MEINEIFQITIKVLEARHLNWPNMDSRVYVSVDKQRKKTAIQRKSESPTFNEFFVFEFECTKQQLLDKVITIAVWQPRTFCKNKKCLGQTKLDIGTVWAQPGKQFYHKWVVLMSKKNEDIGPRGYLLCDISVLTSQDEEKTFPIDLVDEDIDIEGNILMPVGVTPYRQRAIYHVTFWRGEILTTPDDINLKCCSSKCCESNNSRPIDPCRLYIEVAFAGLKGRTSLSEESWKPIWNERVSFIEMFPPLWQRMSLRLRSYVNCCQNRDPVLAIHYFDLKTISDHRLAGFLPTFGPGFIHLVSGSHYRGRLLCELSTELDLEEISITKNVQRTPVISLPEKQFWQERPILLAAALFEVSMLSSHFKDVYFHLEVSLGAIGNRFSEQSSSLNQCSPALMAQKPIGSESTLLSLPIETQIPCMRLLANCPDHSHRIHRSNLLDTICQYLDKELAKLNNLIERELDRNSEELTETANMIIENFMKACDHYNKLSNELWAPQLSLMTTKLDKERHKMVEREIFQMKSEVNEAINLPPEEIYQVLLNIQEKLAFFIEDPQPALPNIFLWLVSGTSKLYASIELKARDFWSVTPVAPVECSGKLTGKMQTLILKAPLRSESVKVVISIWLGPAWEAESRWTLGLPPGFRFPSNLVSELPIPSSITYQEFHAFQCRAHIFQGRYPSGADSSGLSDAFVKVHIARHTRQTKVCRQTLSPFWDECVIFEKITLLGPIKNIKENPPDIILQAWDKDYFGRSDLLGQTLCQPKVKLAKESYFPPKLVWNKLECEENRSGEILAAFEILEINEDALSPGFEKYAFSTKVITVPADIRPVMAKFRLEVYFWGVRDLKLDKCACVRRPCVSIEIGDRTLEGEMAQKNSQRGKAARQAYNFTKPRQLAQLFLPEEVNLHPCILIRVFNRTAFGRRALVGTRLVEGLANHPSKIISRDVWMEKQRMRMRFHVIDDFESNRERKENKRDSRRMKRKSYLLRRWFTNWNVLTESEDESIEPEETRDWWTKYYYSKDSTLTIEECTTLRDENSISVLHKKKQRPWITIYPSELERQPDFKGFSDLIRSFPVSRGQGSKSKRVYGVFKGALILYKWPPSGENPKDWVNLRNGRDLSDGILQTWPENEINHQFIARVYIVRAYDLHPRDSSGKSDPYIQISTPSVNISDQENYLERQTNPIFGKYFELRLSFPTDHTLTVRLIDHDVAGVDDLIGETKIDLELRYFTQHRAATPLQHVYNKQGYNAWRCPWRPSQLLRHLCKEARIQGPTFTTEGVLLGNWDDQDNHLRLDIAADRLEGPNESDALLALHNWHLVPGGGCPLVPEHVETRGLFHPNKPGLVQGRLEMWLELLTPGECHLPSPVPLAPRQPQEFELRVIVWNTRDVILQEKDIFLGERVSDIYVKGWLGDIRSAQSTDVHYRSLTGEGNFNWRMKFPCRYLATENCLVLTEQKGFARLLSETKVPAQLTMQIYDNDTISKDDFLGSMVLELARIPQGAKSPKKCRFESKPRYLNLIHIRRTRGWWPARRKINEGDYELTGKIEMEFELLTKEEAEANPVGLGRKEPEALPKPNRPDTSFTWFRNPMKALKYTIKAHCFKVCCYCCIVIFPTVFFILFFYAFPGYTAKRILGV